MSKSRSSLILNNNNQALKGYAKLNSFADIPDIAWLRYDVGLVDMYDVAWLKYDAGM